jgi:N-acetylneuraminate synthase
MEAVASQGKLTLISTGLFDTATEILDACAVFEEAKCPYVVNHCVAIYPCPPERLYLKFLHYLMAVFSGSSGFKGVGYSGHEVGVTPSIIAAQMGAKWIERHFTLDRSWYGADQAASLEPQGMKRLVRDIRLLRGMIGDDINRVGKLHGDEKNPVKHFNPDWKHEEAHS